MFDCWIVKCLQIASVFTPEMESTVSGISREF